MPTEARTIEVGGLERRYVLHVPSGYAGTGTGPGRAPVPLVLMFHGAMGTAQAAMKTTGWIEKAEQEGFLVAFPEGTRPDPDKPPLLDNPQTWNDGSGRTPAAQRGVDDVEFVRVLLDALQEEFTVDGRRVYATGFSNGGSFVFRLGVELAERFAAIAPVAGVLWLKGVHLKEPVSLIYFIGREDPLVPLQGGRVRLPSGLVVEMPPVHESIERWAELLGCPGRPKLSFPQRGVRLYTCGPCRGGAELEAYIVEGLGHVWPGGSTLLPEAVVGSSRSPIRATDRIWAFFERHPKPVRRG